MDKEYIQEMQEVIPWLIFKLNDNLYTVNSKFITSIVIKPDVITFVPDVPEYINGLIHLRGNVIPLINLKTLLNITTQETKSVNASESNENKEMIVVFERENSFMGLVVDKVLSVENISSYEETEEIKKMCSSGFVSGVAKGQKSNEVLLVLDEEKIMSNA